MKTKYFAIALALLSGYSFAQNDLDALRYSQTNIGGTTRFVSMGGAFGALGANISCMSQNPAGLGIYRKGEMNISPGLRFTSITGTHNGNEIKNFNPGFLFNGLGMVAAWQGTQNEDNHHSVGFAFNQLANFNQKISVGGYSQNKSIANDLLANAGSANPNNLDPSYSGLAFNTYLLDTIDGQYYSFTNDKFNLYQSKYIETTGRMNEFAIAYAYGYKDKLYIGASLGIPSISYNHSSTYVERDDKDSLYIDYNGSTFNTSYDYNVYYYPGLGGFESMSYNETYKTSGRGYNLKLGILYRVNEYLRVGAHYHTPTVLNLTDTYSYKMTTKFDEGDSYDFTFPEDGGIYKYVIITPMRYGASLGFIYKKLFVVGLDYESVNYGQATILGSEAGAFSDVNNTISNKYTAAHNFRLGTEINLNPVVVRLGYASLGSPFGETFTGKFVRNSISGGIGFRSNNWTFDFGLVRQMYNEDYYMYNPKYVNRSDIKFSGTNFVCTVGLKF